ncbi:putative phosphatase regulatory subunit-domain-containing protein [Lipomyces japonicus]|uniref:putative phosphatase regulatory subunit-domain-containing protein n=1 Tax=Lipomyces japonicus TaxID=56871 RepID=UPI0034CF49F9
MDEDDDDDDEEKNAVKPSARHIETRVDSTGSDEDDAATLASSIAALHDVIRQTMPPQRRQASPSRAADLADITSQSMVDLRTAAVDTTSSIAVIDDEYDEDGMNIAPARSRRMVRKKSGELVKPSLKSGRRPLSAPSTPTYPKNVHFDTHLEHVRHFLQAERPAAVSNQASPVDEHDSADEYFSWKPRPIHFSDDFSSSSSSSSASSSSSSSSASSPLSTYVWELGLPNFSAARSDDHDVPVFVERIFLSFDQRCLLGHVAVKNLAFAKSVAAKFTVDYWNTVSEVAAEYSDNRLPPKLPTGYDRFTFSIKLQDFSKLESKILFFCVRYNVNGAEYWDNNHGENYQVEFIRKNRKSSSSSSTASSSSLSSSSHLKFISTSTTISTTNGTSLSPKKHSSQTSHRAFDNLRSFQSSARPPRPAAQDYSFESHYSKKNHANGSDHDDVDDGDDDDDDDDFGAHIASMRSTPPAEMVAPAGRPFTLRYDFRASLDALKNSASSSSESVETPPAVFKPTFAFGSGSAGSRFKIINDSSNSTSPRGMGSPPLSAVTATTSSSKPSLGTGLSTEDLNRVNDQLSSIKRERGGIPRFDGERPKIDSTSYQVFLDNYCFFQPPGSKKNLPGPVLLSPTSTSTSSSSVGSSPVMSKPITMSSSSTSSAHFFIAGNRGGSSSSQGSVTPSPDMSPDMDSFETTPRGEGQLTPRVFE